MEMIKNERKLNLIMDNDTYILAFKNVHLTITHYKSNIKS